MLILASMHDSGIKKTRFWHKKLWFWHHGTKIFEEKPRFLKKNWVILEKNCLILASVKGGCTRFESVANPSACTLSIRPIQCSKFSFLVKVFFVLLSIRLDRDNCEDGPPAPTKYLFVLLYFSRQESDFWSSKWVQYFYYSGWTLRT